MVRGRLRRRLGRINRSLADQPVHSLVDRVEIPHEVASPWVRITKRIVIAMGVLCAVVLIVYIDRDGYSDTQKNGLLNEGVIVGQTWAGPPLSLKNAGEPVMYAAPVEGSLAWVDGLAIPSGAENMDQVYEFIKYAYMPELAGEAIDHHGYNSPVLGADQYSGDTYKKNFAEAYPGDSLANLNPWPAEAPWYAEVRTEFVNRFKSA